VVDDKKDESIYLESRYRSRDSVPLSSISGGAPEPLYSFAVNT
jgi:hypothetical protein